MAGYRSQKVTPPSLPAPGMQRGAELDIPYGFK